MLDLTQGVLEEFSERAAKPSLGQFIDAGLGVWRKDNPETARIRKARWYLKNKEHKREYNRLYRLKMKARA